MSTKPQVHESPEITVTFHPAVFDVGRKRWIRPDLATAEEVAAQVARRPSGVLRSSQPGASTLPQKELP